MSQYQIPPVQPGDALPFYYGMTTDGLFFTLDEQAGRPAAVILIGHDVSADQIGMVESLMGDAVVLASRGADILVFAVGDDLRALSPNAPDGIGVTFVGCDVAYLSSCGVESGQIVVLIIDRNRRVALHQILVPGLNAVTACLDSLDRLPTAPPRDVFLPAPVLTLPNLLPAPVCQYLIEQFESRPTFDSAMASINADSSAGARIDHAKKARRDLLISEEEPLYPLLQEAILRRARPEIARAFQANVTHVDRLLVARYDRTAGWFRRHRDNLAENVAFREFAISINLGADPFEGGDLRFPEYNDHRYRLTVGGALIFSASVLHEVTPIIRGERTALLTFLHSDAAEARRQEYAGRIARAGMANSNGGGAYMANSQTVESTQMAR